MYERSGFLVGFTRDLKYAARGLTKSRTFTLVCLLSLAIGFGINLAIVILLQDTLAPPRAVKAEGAVELRVTTRGLVLDEVWSYPDFADVKSADTGMDVAAWIVGTRNLRTDDSNDGARVSAMYASANYFHTLGVAIAPGRAFLPEEDRPTADPPIVISEDMWTSRLHADPGIVGRPLNLNGTRYTVIGVASQRFRGHRAGQEIDVWIPLWGHSLFSTESRLRNDRGADRLQVVGRLHEGVSMAQANGALGAVMRSLAEAHAASNAFRGAVVVRYTKQGVGDEDTLLVTMFLSLSGMVLLVVCLNVSGMVLVRSATRERELALRMALGSSRVRLVRYLVTEAGLIAFLGGVLSVAASLATLQVLSWRTDRLIPADLLLTVVMVCFGLSIVAMLVIGLSPALKFSRPQLLGSLKDAGVGGGRRSGWIHRFATSVQTALALPLLVINGMVLQATGVMDQADYGFEPDNLLVSTLDLEAEGYADEEVEPFLRRLRESVGSLAGVESVSIADGIPLDYTRRSRRVSRAGEEASIWIEGTRATERYFETIGTPIVRGRGLESGDRAGAEPAAVVTESLAARLWPGQDALGKRVRFAFDRTSSAEFTVVGIAADVTGSSHESDPTNIFVSLWQQPSKRITLVIRTASRDAAIGKAIQDTVLALDPDLTRPTVMTSRSLMEEPRAEIYTMSMFLGGLSVLTLLLAALGVYGVVAFAVTNRTREIGVRMAIGASRLRVLAMVLTDGAKLALPGVAIGSVLAAFLAHAILERWYAYLDRATVDWTALSVAAGAALTVVLLASSMPARRAANVQPMEALRTD